MPVLKCKMCGGDIVVDSEKTFGTCEYCGSVMTLPRVDDEQRASMFNRGNHFRRIGEYDKALGVYERIVAEDNNDAEAHWCCALSRFGIEYVEDPVTYEWLPTCHRLSFDSFLEDVDYLAAVENSDGITRRQYQKDAAKIAEVQRGILAVSQKEEPFDVFICYKESDENNNRTVDSTLAQDIYYQLADKGYKVFFSRITLEDKVGTEYEPYIFAALNSAKVMVVVGTKPEYLNAVWVKNEWSRFLQLMKKDRSRVIIPCYRDMDPYDLPEQLSVLQSYDMSKIGFVQDLLRGISKIVGKDNKNTQSVQQSVVQQTGPNVTALLKRGNMALEDGEWDSARKYFDEALNMNAESAEAYLGLAMADTKSRDEKAFGNYLKYNDFSNRNYDRALQFAGDDLQKKADFWAEQRKQEVDRQKQQELEKSYQEALGLKQCAKTSDDFKQAAARFKQISEYKDSSKQVDECIEKASIREEEQKEEALRSRYQNAVQMMQTATAASQWRFAEKELTEIKDYKNAAELIDICQAKAAELEEKERIVKAYKTAIDVKRVAKTSKQYYNAAQCFEKASGYMDADILRKECYNNAKRIESEENRMIQLKTDYEKSRKEVSANLVDIGNQIGKKEDELSHLGIFKGKEKAALKQQIDALISKREQTIEDYKRSTSDYWREIGYIGLGTWPMNSTSMIEWITLAKENGKMLLISKQGIDAMYYSKAEYTKWSTCDLRKWLNKEFYEKAFNEVERSLISVTTIKAEKNTNNTAFVDQDTHDKVFLLSVSEAEQYFKNSVERQLTPTSYATSHGAKVNSNGNCAWWLRTKSHDFLAAMVDVNGKPDELGASANRSVLAVRPAVWITIE